MREDPGSVRMAVHRKVWMLNVPVATRVSSASGTHTSVAAPDRADLAGLSVSAGAASTEGAHAICGPRALEDPDEPVTPLQRPRSVCAAVGTLTGCHLLKHPESGYRTTGSPARSASPEG